MKAAFVPVPARIPVHTRVQRSGSYLDEGASRVPAVARVGLLQHAHTGRVILLPGYSVQRNTQFHVTPRVRSTRYRVSGNAIGRHARRAAAPVGPGLLLNPRERVLCVACFGPPEIIGALRQVAPSEVLRNRDKTGPCIHLRARE
jgi:hypothetical protein